MNISSPEVAKALAEGLACGDDREQAAFFNTFFKEIDLACKGDGDGQLYHTVKHLDGNGRQGLKKMARNLELREQSDKEAKEVSS